ncbi:MAG: hypothetical protein ABI212_09915 [Burkholderiaceae bacterium]
MSRTKPTAHVHAGAEVGGTDQPGHDAPLNVVRLQDDAVARSAAACSAPRAAA